MPELWKAAGERSIRGEEGLRARLGLCVVLVLCCASSLAGCGGEQEQTPIPSAESPATPDPVEAPTVQDGVPVGTGQAETTRDVPFTLNTEQPVPPNFREAYGRQARIVVQFYKLDEDSLSYPQGLSVDQQVSEAIERLGARYPTIEFFSYEISDPGPVEGEGELETGEYGTLPAQLGVGVTPYVAMMAPSGDGYVITNLFQGYVPEPVLSQALFDLAAVEVEDNTSDVNVTLDQVETTDSGGGIEYFGVRNRSERPVNLQGFTLRVLDPETAQVTPGAPGVTIDSDVEVEPGQSVSLGRVPDLVDGEGERVAGTFEGGSELELAPGDQVALLDPGGAVASTITV
ncbi:MAG: hypothetical protein ACRDTR_24260 [Rubrobacter sp.]